MVRSVSCSVKNLRGGTALTKYWLPSERAIRFTTLIRCRDRRTEKSRETR